MSENIRIRIRIRKVTVELLRSGASHNQLLSPLTLYLGICDEAEAGIVTLPFEHHTFLRRMSAMRYDDNASSRAPPNLARPTTPAARRSWCPASMTTVSAGTKAPVWRCVRAQAA